MLFLDQLLQLLEMLFALEFGEAQPGEEVVLVHHIEGPIGGQLEWLPILVMIYLYISFLLKLKKNQR